MSKDNLSAEEVLSEITGIPVYRIKCDDKGEYITKKGALQAMKKYASIKVKEREDEIRKALARAEDWDKALKSNTSPE